MKVHQQFARAIWDSTDHTCKRLRPLAPKLSPSDEAGAAVDLKSFIRPDGGPRKLAPPHHAQETTSLCQQGQGGTRWNPTQEQIEILEKLYRGGMRTPNADQIEQITAQLCNYGKIEGKNVFYWFQNHKARERQKQKRHSKSLLSVSSPPSSTAPLISNNNTFTLNFRTSTNSKEDIGREEQATSKRKCRTWMFECILAEENTTATNDHYRDYSTKSITANFVSGRDEEEEEEMGHKKTLKLFPLHPEGRSMMGVPTI